MTAAPKKLRVRFDRTRSYGCWVANNADIWDREPSTHINLSSFMTAGKPKNFLEGSAIVGLPGKTEGRARGLWK